MLVPKIVGLAEGLLVFTQGILMIKKKLWFILLFLMQGGMLLGIVQEHEIIADIDDIPRVCANLMEGLFNQEVSSLSPRMCQSLQIPDLIEGNICLYLNRNSRFTINGRVYYFDRIRVNKLVIYLPERLFSILPEKYYSEFRRLDKSKAYEGCSPELFNEFLNQSELWSKELRQILFHEYKRIVEQLKFGWMYFPPENSSGVAFPDLETDWIFLAKRKCLNVESDLITNLTCKFGLSNLVVCRDSDISRGEAQGKVYLWIKKHVMQDFDRIFKFKNIRRFS